MNRELIQQSRKKIMAGALAGTLIVSGLGISLLVPETADAADGTGSSSAVLLAEKDPRLATLSQAATSIKTYSDYTAGDYQKVSLKGDKIAFEGTGATVSGSDLLITAGGTYVLSGTLNDGAIIVDDTADQENVVLVLNNAKITCKDGAPIYVKNSGKNVIIALPKGTDNTVTDGASYTYQYLETSTDKETGETSSQPTAAIFSKDDLRINGTGKLTVKANYKDGITGKDDVEIAEATLVIQSADDGIVGKDSVAIASGSFTIKAGGDGIKSTNSEDAAKGYIAIADGTFQITSGNDGIQAESILLTLGGDYTIKTGGGAAASTKSREEEWMLPAGGWQGQAPDGTTPANTGRGANGVSGGAMAFDRTSGGAMAVPGSFPERGNGTQKANGSANANQANNSTTTAAAATTEETESDSIKALKAGTKVAIQGGNFTIDSQDDAIHSNDGIALAGGTFQLASGDDAVHADNILNIYGGDMNITASYEGLEGKQINISGGDIDLVASDDGINVSGGNDNSGFGGFGGFPGFGSFGTAAGEGGETAANVGAPDKNTASGTGAPDSAPAAGTANGKPSEMPSSAAASSGTTPAAATTSPSAATAAEVASTLRISGGKINVNAGGDGIDVNGSGYMTGGTVAVSGPTDNGNSGLDYDGVFEVTGGTLVITGSSGMAMAPTASGTTVNTLATAVSSQPAGTQLKLVNSAGTAVITFTAEKAFTHVVISSPVIKTGETYKLMTGSTELASFTADSTVTNLSGGMGGGRGQQPGNMQGGSMLPPERQ